MLMVGELAARCGVPAHVVRFYAKKGLLVPTRNPGNGYRMYQQEHVVLLKFIRRAQALGFTLDDIQKFINHRKQGRAPCAMVQRTLDQRMKETQEKIDELVQKQERMRQAKHLWEAMEEGGCEEQTICHLVEAVEVEQ